MGELASEGFLEEAPTKNECFSGAPSDERGVSRFTIALARSSMADRLGIDIKLEPTCLRILQIREGMVSAWNSEHPELAVRPDDIFVKINEVAGDAQRMVSECQDQTCETLVVLVVRGMEHAEETASIKNTIDDLKENGRVSGLDDRGESQFTIALMRSGTANKLGVDIELEPPSRHTYIRIQNIVEGMINEWNIENPELAVVPDDVFVEVNGIGGDAQRMIDEFQNQARETLFVEVVRGRGPPSEY